MISVKDLQSEDSSFHSTDVHEDTLPGNIVNDPLHCEERLDFSADERGEAEKNYRTLKHDEKLNRLFLVLEIIVELFEVDMSVFLVKRSFDLRKALCYQLYRPLVVSVLWKGTTVKGIGHLNGICRCIISLYAKCFVHKIRVNQRNVVAVSIIEYEQHRLTSSFGRDSEKTGQHIPPVHSLKLVHNDTGFLIFTVCVYSRHSQLTTCGTGQCPQSGSQSQMVRVEGGTKRYILQKNSWSVLSLCFLLLLCVL
jgi:hypothetical protein